MENINRSEISQELTEITGLSSARLTNLTVNRMVQPVIELHPRLVKAANIVGFSAGSASGSVVLYTTPTTGKFFLLGVQWGYVKDVVCDMATGIISVNADVVGRGTYQIASFSVIALTAQQSNQCITFARPIELIANTPILITGTFAAGVCNRTGHIQGYLQRD